MAQYAQAIYNQNLQREALEELNWNKRKEIVRYAYEHVPFYRDYYEEKGFSPDDLHCKEDWEKVPPLEKEHIRVNKQRMLSSSVPPCSIALTSTGGSTGMPLSVYRDKRFKFEILGWRAFTWWGISPADNTGIMHRRVPTNWVDKLKNRMLWCPTKRIYLNANRVEETDIARFVREITTQKIIWLTGYVGTLERVADYVLREGIKISCLRMVWSTSAPLSAIVRDKLERAFGCKVMNQYGSCEVSNIAQQCPCSEHLHVNVDYVHVDIVDEWGRSLQRQEGDILVTDLANYVAPLIRYRIGDRGELVEEPCPCGVTLPLMKNVKGRISDAVYTPSGIYIDGSYLTTIFDRYSSYIDKFQVRQTLDYSIKVLVVLKRPVTSGYEVVLREVKELLCASVKDEIPVSVEEVPEIHDDKGKIRYIISEVALRTRK